MGHNHALEARIAKIPLFDAAGILPAIWPGAGEVDLNRSPYPSDILTFCRRFGLTPDRRRILRGLLRFRKEMRDGGVKEGYQWLDGSFTEDVERIRGRSPEDVDVVTFAVIGEPYTSGMSDEEIRAAAAPIRSSYPHWWSSKECKRRYFVDHYLLRTNVPLNEAYLRTVCYWYSIWSHQRDTMTWKGFVTVDLYSNDDDALALLDRLDQVSSPDGGAI